ncbi:MAG: GGDEF domain-containing protein [Ruminiclostridium sp.]|nr:GGDEF domain-containing protein [Ruminiclostridium sp.]
MNGNDAIFSKIAEALLIDYTSVYYVNAKTFAFKWYSVDPEYHSLHIAKEGPDFFENLKTDVLNVVYEEDRHIFTEKLRKENLLAAMKNGSMQSIKYRLMIDGKPVYHTLRLIRGAEGDDDCFILGIINIDKEVRMREETEKLEKEREIYNQIAESLAGKYESLFYIDIETGRYFEFSSNDNYKSMHVPTIGADFYSETRDNVRRYVYKDDRKTAEKLYYKETMLEKLGSKSSYSYKYRIVNGDNIINYRFTVMLASDSKHFIISVEDIDDEIEAEKTLTDTRRKSITYGQIAESLASQYDVIYYVDINSGSYVEYTLNSIYGNLEIQEEGYDFFTESRRNASQILHPKDKERVLTVLGKDYLISALHDKKQYSTDYRLIIDGKPQYTRLTVMWSSDKVHFIIGVENVNDEVKKEKEQLKALNLANEMARRDELTGTKNKTAYAELERSVQNNIDSGMDYLPFALVVCDINGLKQINDSDGHRAGDEYIRAAAKLICEIFAHSPVFRIGGDEFVIFLRGNDYPCRDALIGTLHTKVTENLKKKGEPVIAAGIAVYDPESDTKISEVFERADNMMYEDKRALKDMLV